MEKITLEICCGTTCYMLGAAPLLKMESLLPKEWKENVDISAVACLGECLSNKLCNAPYVRINGKIMEKATVQKVLDSIQKILKEKQ